MAPAQHWLPTRKKGRARERCRECGLISPDCQFLSLSDWLLTGRAPGLTHLAVSCLSWLSWVVRGHGSAFISLAYDFISFVSMYPKGELYMIIRCFIANTAFRSGCTDSHAHRECWRLSISAHFTSVCLVFCVYRERHYSLG